MPLSQIGGPMTILRDRLCVVTGAGSGIGRAVSLQLARDGARLCLVDVNEDNLRQTQGMAAQFDAECASHVVDVANREQVDDLARVVEERDGGASALLNIAGVMLYPSDLELVAPVDFSWVFDVNFGGVVNMCRAFLPQLRRQSEAHILNTASLAGLVGMMGVTAYGSSKFAVRGFSEGLRMDLFGTGVAVTTAFPGVVPTDIYRHARGYTQEALAKEEKRLTAMPHTSPDKAAAKILHGIRHNKARVLIGTETKVVDLIVRLLPAGYAPLLAGVARRATDRRTVGDDR